MREYYLYFDTYHSAELFDLLHPTTKPITVRKTWAAISHL